MRFHAYLLRGVLTECRCGHSFHVPEERLVSFACPCGHPCEMDLSEVNQLLELLETSHGREAAQPVATRTATSVPATLPRTLKSPFYSIRRLAGAAVVLALGMVTQPVQAQGLASPEGPVILVVSGDVAESNQGDLAAFDREMLEALETVSLTTTTAWTEGPVTFDGPLARDVLALVGADGEVVTATALNDYAVDIPFTDFQDYDVVLALKMNGEAMSVRDKGPIWIVYPRDDHAELQTVEYNARWIWQLRSLNVENP